MNKKHCIILTLILCFSLAFAVHPLRTFAFTEAELAQIEANLAIVESVNNGTYTPPPPSETETPSDTTGGTTTGGTSGGNEDNEWMIGIDCSQVEDEDWDSLPPAVDALPGQTVTGLSGTTYKLEESPPGAATDYVWVPENGGDGTPPTDGGDKHYYCNACSGKNCVTFTYSTPCSDYCPNNCGGTTPPPAGVTPPAATQDTYQCFCGQQLTGTYTCNDSGCTECQCGAGGTCSVVYSYTPCSDTCRTGADCGDGGGGPSQPPSPYVPPISPPPTSPPPTCQIIEFSLNGKTNEDQNPLIVWVNAVLRGYFSVLDSCKTCTVSSNDTWGNPPQTYEITTLDSDYTETFKINTSGTYSYTLECVGTDPEDIVTDILSLQTVKALNLPWWREIIPNLGGFLRGMIR